MSTPGARKLFFVRKYIYACIRWNEGAKGAKGAMLKSTVHTFAFLCKMTMPRNFFFSKFLMLPNCLILNMLSAK